jgi:energy-coupling factor transporter ATP-binding protein EcfA2
VVVTEAIHISSLKYSYPGTEHPALIIDELAIDQGEICWVAGLSGAGKTTLCRLLAGLIPHFYRGNLSGSVKIQGQECLHLSLSEVTGLVGFVMGDPFDQLTRATYTVRDEITFGLQNLGLPVGDISLRAKQVMQDLEITHLADRLPTSLSAGERQRVVIASIFARRPRVLVLDEATSQLDPLGAEAIFQLAIRLKSLGNTIVMVEPRPDKVSQIADRLVLLHQGKVLANGPVGEVINSGIFEQAGLHLPSYPDLASMLIASGVYAGKLPVSLSDACEMVGNILHARR